MRARCALKFIPATPPVTPYFSRSLRRVARSPNRGPNPEAKKRQKWFNYYFSHGRSASLTCRHFDVSRKTFYKWLARYDLEGESGLKDRSKAPMNKRKRKIDPEIERRIIDLRKKYIRYGKEKLAVIYEKTYREKISSWQIQRTIEDKDLYWLPTEAAKQRRRRFLGQKKKRITQLVRTEPKGFFFQIDTKHIWWNGEKFYVFTAYEKDYKLGFANAYKGMSSLKATDFLARLLYLFDGKMELLQTDNGPEFAKHFERACQTLKIDRYYSRVKTPTDNAEVERFNRTLWEEFVERGNFTPFMEEFNPRLAQWLVEYNFNRPHRSLGMLSPMEFFQKCQGVSPMYPTHTRPLMPHVRI